MEAIYGGNIPQQKINGLPDLETQIQENRANIANQKPIKIRGERFKMGTGTLKADVEQLFREHGNMAHNDVLGDVDDEHKGTSKTPLHTGCQSEKAALYEAVPALIQNGKIVDYVENHKGRGYNSAVLEAPVTIAKKREMQRVIILRRLLFTEQLGDKRPKVLLCTMLSIKKIKDGIYNNQTRSRRGKPQEQTTFLARRAGQPVFY